MIVRDVICPFCGCLCDDLEIETEGGKIVKVQNGCALAESTFINDTRLPSPIRRTETGWEKITYDEAIKETADILRGMRTVRSCTGGAARTARPRASGYISPNG